MAGNVNINLSYTIQGQDITANVAVFQRALQNFQLAATAWQASDFAQVPLGGLAIPITAIGGTAYFVYVRNLGANNITVSYTPTAAPATTLVLLPVGTNSGGIFLYALSAETGGGIIAMTLTASTATTPAEYFIAA
jgi:hypothetical protein